MSERHVVVIGGGAVGLGAALFLQQEGFAVTLVDRAEPGQATSFGNAGIIAVQSVRSINTPEVLASLPGLLFRRRSPLRIRWRDLPATAPWLLAFARNCTSARSAAAGAAQAALCREAANAWRVLLQRCGGNERVSWPGWLKLAETEAAALGLALERDLLEAEGHDCAWLDGDAVRALEPELGPRFTAGLWLEENGQVDRPHELLRLFAQRFAAEGGTIVRDEVRDIVAAGEGVAVVGAAGRYPGEQAVLAAGPWSAGLARRLGCRVRLVAERGYHLMLPQPRMPVTRTLYSVRDGFVLAPMGDSLRLTGGAEIARLDTPPDEGPIRALLPAVRRLLPRAATEVASSWMGRRPSTADGRPVIDRAPALPRVVLAYGHGHVGLTLGPVTGRLVADLVVGRPAAVDLDAYAAVRRRRREFPKKDVA